MGLKKPTISNELNPWNIAAVLLSAIGIFGGIAKFESNQSSDINVTMKRVDNLEEFQVKTLESQERATERDRKTAEILAGVQVAIQQLIRDSHRHNP